METTKKQKTIAVVTTLVIHALVLVLLAYLTLSAAERENRPDDGIPVLLGEVPDAGGENLGG